MRRALNFSCTQATWTNWISAHVRAFAAIGGVPGLLVPDNTKVAATGCVRGAYGAI